MGLGAGMRANSYGAHGAHAGTAGGAVHVSGSPQSAAAVTLGAAVFCAAGAPSTPPVTIAAAAGGGGAGGAGGGHTFAAGHGGGTGGISMGALFAAVSSNGSGRGRHPQLMRAGSRLQMATTPTTQPSIPEDTQALDIHTDLAGAYPFHGGAADGTPSGPAATTPRTIGGTHGEERRRLLLGLPGSEGTSLLGMDRTSGAGVSPPCALAVVAAEGRDGAHRTRPHSTAAHRHADANDNASSAVRGMLTGALDSAAGDAGGVTRSAGLSAAGSIASGGHRRGLFLPSPSPNSAPGSGGEGTQSHGSHRHVQEAVVSSRPQTRTHSRTASTVLTRTTNSSSKRLNSMNNMPTMQQFAVVNGCRASTAVATPPAGPLTGTMTGEPEPLANAPGSMGGSDFASGATIPATAVGSGSPTGSTGMLGCGISTNAVPTAGTAATIAGVFRIGTTLSTHGYASSAGAGPAGTALSHHTGDGSSPAAGSAAETSNTIGRASAAAAAAATAASAAAAAAAVAAAASAAASDTPGAQKALERGWRTLTQIMHRLNARPGDYLTRIVMEDADRGSLLGAIREHVFVHQADGTPHWPWLLLTALDMARGMAFLHRHNVRPAAVCLLDGCTWVVALATTCACGSIAVVERISSREPHLRVSACACVRVLRACRSCTVTSR